MTHFVDLALAHGAGNGAHRASERIRIAVLQVVCTYSKCFLDTYHTYKCSMTYFIDLALVHGAGNGAHRGSEIIRTAVLQRICTYSKCLSTHNTPAYVR